VERVCWSHKASSFVRKLLRAYLARRRWTLTRRSFLRALNPMRWRRPVFYALRLGGMIVLFNVGGVMTGDFPSGRRFSPSPSLNKLAFLSKVIRKRGISGCARRILNEILSH
jgi:hypothetical protein